MKSNKTAVLAVLMSVAVNSFAGQIDGGAVIGSMVGAGVGSAVGSSAGGKQGAIIGGGVGGALGAAVGSNQGSTRERVVYDEDRRAYHRHDNGHHYGEYKHGHDRD